VEPDGIIDALESLAVGAVAVTTLSLAQAGVELTFAQWRVLMILADTPDGATVGEIAGRIGSATSPASRLVARMRTHGMVQTRKDPRDHRATRVQLSDEGWAIRDRVLVRRRELLSMAIAPLEPLKPAARVPLDRLAAALRSIG
jgi:DNA-binding MarR family transcriptional regulator